MPNLAGAAAGGTPGRAASSGYPDAGAGRFGGSPAAVPHEEAGATQEKEAQKEAALQSDDGRSPGSTATPSSSVTERDTSEGVLDALEVGPSVRLTRLVSSPDAFSQRYEILSPLGSGMSGGVMLARARASGAEVAVKTLPTCATESACGVQWRERVLAEVQNQLAMDHPNICRLLEVYEEPGRLRLVMERLRGPDLLEHLSRKGRYTEGDAADCVRQICAAVAYCHRHGVCHRDLKLENFCLEDDSPDAPVKMIDFGLSRACKKAVPMTDACGTLYYLAPEVFKRHYDQKCDMWSLGVIAYVLLDGRPPFHGTSDAATAAAIQRGSYKFREDRWANISPYAKDFIARLLQVDPNRRLDAERALAHKWLDPQTTMAHTPSSSSTAEDAQAPAPAPALDVKVLQGMRAFTRCNVLKRAVLRAVAPLATVEQVARWSEAFKALDTEGTGEVAVQDLARQLVENADLCDSEAAELCAALAGADGGEQISYSAFLAACLSVHMTFDDEMLRALFDRVDKNSDGHCSIEEVCNAFGDVIDIGELKDELRGQTISYSDFRWLVAMPRLGPATLDLGELLNGEDVRAGWRVSSQKAKNRPGDADEQVLEASRRENLAWRLWTKLLTRQAGGEVAVEKASSEAGTRSPRSAAFALSLDAQLVGMCLCGEADVARMRRAEKRQLLVAELVRTGRGSEVECLLMTDQQLVELARSPSDLASEKSPSMPPSPRTPAVLSPGGLGTGCSPRPRADTKQLVEQALGSCDEQGDWLTGDWVVAAVQAKEGCVEAARRENLAWRVRGHRRNKSDGETLQLRLPKEVPAGL